MRYDPVVESEVRFILLLKVVQSVDESAPILPDDESPSESCCPESESQLAVQRVTAAWVADWSAAICPDIVLTVLEIVVTVPERVVTVLVSVFSDPERVAILPVAVARLEFVIVRAPERVL
jgi:hypothetical protein